MRFFATKTPDGLQVVIGAGQPALIMDLPAHHQHWLMGEAEDSGRLQRAEQVLALRIIPLTAAGQPLGQLGPLRQPASGRRA